VEDIGSADGLRGLLVKSDGAVSEGVDVRWAICVLVSATQNFYPSQLGLHSDRIESRWTVHVDAYVCSTDWEEFLPSVSSWLVALLTWMICSKHFINVLYVKYNSFCNVYLQV
jgi:hypothetical protein